MVAVVVILLIAGLGIILTTLIAVLLAMHISELEQLMPLDLLRERYRRRSTVKTNLRSKIPHQLSCERAALWQEKSKSLDL